TDVKAIKEIARRYALQNAILFDGVCQLKAVMGKVIARFHDEKVHPKEIIPLVNDVVSEVNSLPLEEQRAELQEIAPELLEKKKQERDYSLPDIPTAVMGEVITRFPPEPNGYLHIGHAKAAIVDFEYARKYEGKFILRFDDTNPLKDKIEFYDAQKNDLTWLGISWDESYHTSDNLPKHYKLAEQLILQGDAYVCTCSSDRIKEGRRLKTACPCQKRSIEEQMASWVQMHERTLAAVLRLQADMTSVNTAMRDPTLFRIITDAHPLQEDRFHVWPTYDFAGAVEDSLSGVTHPFRTKEYELRDEVYFYLLDKLRLRKPCLMEFARLSIEGMPVSKRLILPLVTEGKVSGFDDVRLPTLQGLRRRGIVPEALKSFVLQQGISKVESTVPFSLVESENRKIIDPITKRFFFVPDPVVLQVNNAPMRTVSILFHPRNQTLGERTINTTGTFYISKTDVDLLHVSDVFRLKDLFNVSVETIQDKRILGSYVGDDLVTDTLKIQWVTEDYIPLSVYIPDTLFKNDEFNKKSLREVNGYGESAIQKLSTGDQVQFERFGFVRIERDNDQLLAFFSHR
ncbi:MAG: glutamate--tRNA ligase, partial [Candidatus Thermoplasmatota archaeon]|nr:glutamate--tRNA ligase [Candidatus Thermoplasmatota archaeon]